MRTRRTIGQGNGHGSPSDNALPHVSLLQAPKRTTTNAKHPRTCETKQDKIPWQSGCCSGPQRLRIRGDRVQRCHSEHEPLPDRHLGFRETTSSGKGIWNSRRLGFPETTIEGDGCILFAEVCLLLEIGRKLQKRVSNPATLWDSRQDEGSFGY